jgi:L-fucose mutarotase
MLKGIPKVISPELIKVLMEMGHGDEIVIADGNFPSASMAKNLIRLDGHGVPVILEAILQFFPLDDYVESPVVLMDNNSDDRPDIWTCYEDIVKPYEKKISQIERFEFYDRAKQAYAIIATSEPAIFANIILKKGCV